MAITFTTGTLAGANLDLGQLAPGEHIIELSVTGDHPNVDTVISASRPDPHVTFPAPQGDTVTQQNSATIEFRFVLDEAGRGSNQSFTLMVENADPTNPVNDAYTVECQIEDVAVVDPPDQTTDTDTSTGGPAGSNTATATATNTVHVHMPPAAQPAAQQQPPPNQNQQQPPPPPAAPTHPSRGWITLLILALAVPLLLIALGTWIDAFDSEPPTPVPPADDDVADSDDDDGAGSQCCPDTIIGPKDMEVKILEDGSRQIGIDMCCDDDGSTDLASYRLYGEYACYDTMSLAAISAAGITIPAADKSISGLTCFGRTKSAQLIAAYGYKKN